MEFLNEELLDLWRLFHEYEVEYIIVGGFAVNLYGHRRFTADLDLWIKDTIDNRRKLRTLLEQINGGNLQGLETIQLVPGWSSIRMKSGFELDLMTFMSGFTQEQFDDCFQHASVGMIYDIPIRFLHYNHLIESKKATGRPKDLLDIEELEKINGKPQ